MITIEFNHYSMFRQMTPSELAKVLEELAAKVKLSAFKKHSRGPKKLGSTRIRQKNKPHVSTAKILEERKARLLP
jgi:hypothetical protein